MWRERGLRPWLADVSEVSADTDFEAKLTDVIGLYVDSPERVVAFGFDEKTQVQALDRTQSSLPVQPRCSHEQACRRSARRCRRHSPPQPDAPRIDHAWRNLTSLLHRARLLVAVAAETWPL